MHQATKIYGQQNWVIHMALGQLGLPYNENRAFWGDVISGLVKGPARSLSELTLFERGQFIQHLKTKGAKVKKPFVPSTMSAWKKGDPDQTVSSGTRRPMRVPEDKKPLIGKINAILLDLGLEWEYADGIASQMGFTPRRCEWCSVHELYRIAQALSFHQAKSKRRYHG